MKSAQYPEHRNVESPVGSCLTRSSAAFLAASSRAAFSAAAFSSAAFLAASSDSQGADMRDDPNAQKLTSADASFSDYLTCTLHRTDHCHAEPPSRVATKQLRSFKIPDSFPQAARRGNMGAGNSQQPQMREKPAVTCTSFLRNHDLAMERG